jgi:Mor family transcriptional regulator
MNMPEDDLHDYLVTSMTSAMTSAGIGLSLAQTIAMRVDEDIRSNLGGERLYVKAPSRKSRNRSIISEWKKGVSRNEIAKKLGLHRSTVDKIICRNLDLS